MKMETIDCKFLRNVGTQSRSHNTGDHNMNLHCHENHKSNLVGAHFYCIHAPPCTATGPLLVAV
jgi:hypothetical protein